MIATAPRIEDTHRVARAALVRLEDKVEFGLSPQQYGRLIALRRMYPDLARR